MNRRYAQIGIGIILGILTFAAGMATFEGFSNHYAMAGHTQK